MGKLKHIGVLSTATTLGGVYAILGLIYGLIYFVLMMVLGAVIGSAANSTSAAGAGMAIFGVGGVFIVVLMVIVFAILGFIGGAIMAFVYNLIAKYTGGISFEVTE